MEHSFSLDELNLISSFAGRKRYCQQHFKKIASGSSRSVFDMGDNRVLKLAINSKGLAQNEIESDAMLHHDYGHILTRVHDSYDNLWLIADKAEKVNAARFRELSGGVSAQDLHNICLHLDSYKLRRGHVDIQDHEVELLEANETFNDMYNMANDYSLLAGDWRRISSWGEVDGELVISDYGLSLDVFNEFYRKQKKTRDHGMGF